MRTTIRLEDQLLREAKTLAASTGRSLTEVIEEALREKLARSYAPAAHEEVDLPTFSGKLRPGVDLDDSASLLDLMDAWDAAP
jgi:hypothetical protein